MSRHRELMICNWIARPIAHSQVDIERPSGHIGDDHKPADTRLLLLPESLLYSRLLRRMGTGRP